MAPVLESDRQALPLWSSPRGLSLPPATGPADGLLLGPAGAGRRWAGPVWAWGRGPSRSSADPCWPPAPAELQPSHWGPRMEWGFKSRGEALGRGSGRQSAAGLWGPVPPGSAGVGILQVTTCGVPSRNCPPAQCLVRHGQQARARDVRGEPPSAPRDTGWAACVSGPKDRAELVGRCRQILTNVRQKWGPGPR